METLLTLEQLAERLQLPKTTLYRWRCKGRGPRAIVVGRYIRFRPTDVEAWLEEQTNQTSKAKAS